MGRDLSRYEAALDELVEVDGAGLDPVPFLHGARAVLRRLNRIGSPSSLAVAVDGLTLTMEGRGAVVPSGGGPASPARLWKHGRPGTSGRYVVDWGDGRPVEVVVAGPPILGRLDPWDKAHHLGPIPDPGDRAACVESGASRLVWTSETPREPGWYWVLVRGGSPFVEEFLDGRVGKPGNPAVLYAGPISPPEEPTHGD